MVLKQDVTQNIKISSGNKDLDHFLEGGYDTDIITTIYGPSGSGKTTLCMLASISSVINNKKKVIYIDTEGGFSVERLKQIVPKDYEYVMRNMLFLKPVNFAEQQKAFDKLRALMSPSIGLIVVDTISMLYRLALAQSKNIYDVNSKLSQQMSFLTEISRKNKIPVLIANQVYSSFEEKDKVNIVGGDILKYSCKTLIEIQSLKNSIRCLFIRKSRSLEEGKSFFFKLINDGIEKNIMP